MKKSSLLHSILFIFICMLPSRCSREPWEGRIYKENGVKVIESHGSGLWGEIIEDKIDFITELTIGEEVGENHLVFHSSLDVAVDSNQDIYVLDKRNHRFMKFDSKGNHIWTSGRQGQGPGELQNPNKIKITPSKGICILDGSDKIHFYDLQGRYIQNRIYMLLPDTYEIREYDVDGTFIRKIRRDFKFTPPEVKRIGVGGFSVSSRTRLGPIYLLMSKYLVCTPLLT